MATSNREIKSSVNGEDKLSWYYAHPEDMRRVQAELVRVVMEGDTKNSKLLEEHSVLLDCDIIINTDDCDCSEIQGFYSDCEMDLEEIVKLVRKGHCNCIEETLDAVHRISQRLIHAAAFQKHLWILKFLSEHGCDLNAKTNYMVTPLFFSVKQKHTEGVEFLLSKNVDPNIRCTDMQNTALMEAVDSGEFHIFSLLLEMTGICLNTTNRKGKTALHKAVILERTDFLEKLIEAGADVNIKAWDVDSPLLYAVNLECFEAVKCLLKHGAEVNIMDFTGSTSLHILAREGNMELIELLLAAGADPNITCQEHDTPLINAAYYDNDETNYNMIKTLISYGAEVNVAKANGYTATHITSWNGHVRSLQELLKAGALHDTKARDKNTPLALAAHGNHPDVMDILLPLGCDINNADKDKDTVLHYAAYTNMVEAVKKLIESGADPNIRNRLDTTPLWNAVYQNNKDVLKILLKANVDLEVPSVGIKQDSHNPFVTRIYDIPRSPLWVAMAQNYCDIVMMLVTAGYDIYGEEWLVNGDFPESAGNNDKLCSLLSQMVISPPRLLTLCRKHIRMIFRGQQIQESVDRLEIPGYLKRYLTLHELM